MPVIDLRPLPASERELEYQKIADRAAMYVFNLAQEPLLRTQLVQLTATESVLLLTIHHIIFDGWSVNIFLKELSTVYSALVEERAPTLPEIRLQYVDFAVWQQQSLQREALESQLAYWQQKLALMPALLELPSDRPRPAVQSFRGATQVFTIQQDISEALVSLSQQQGVTLFILLLTAFKILLYRYTNQSDIVVGTPVANRQHSQIQEMIGFFVNTLVLRTDLSNNFSFLELLKQVRVVALEAYDRQNLPFEKLVEALQPERNLSYAPLVQVSFTLYEPIPTLTLEGLTINTSEVGANHTAKFDLSLLLQKTEQGLTGVFEYNTDLFDDGRIAQMVGHFQTLLEGIVANPRQSISQLPLLTATERQQLLVDWNNTFVEYPQDKCIHQLFEEQVERSPNAIALVFEGEELTYQELNTRANQLAHYLQTLGVGAEVLVGICVERSLEMVVGLLGILKAGGAYVPLDPDYPQERLSFMFADTQLKVLLTQEKLVESLIPNQARVVCLDTDWQSISLENQNNFNSTVSSENLSYVIYTSGSTGTPKGVAVTHQAVNRLVKNTNYIQLTPSDRVAQAANIAFDAATFEIWGALLSGAKLVIITKSVLLSPPEFAFNIHYHQISVLFLTTALFNQLASFVPQAFSYLRCLLFGGEAVDPKWVQQVLDKGAPQQLLHVYGPTENTTFSSWYLVEDLPTTATTIPIGRAISNTQIYLLDQNLQPVPVGVPGELHIGGAGLARGYLNRPELTEEKFIPNPYSNEPGERLYKTGDRVRYLSDGNIEFLGRIDNQVKIRGYRIELGEIEVVLNQHPDVQETVVIDREDIPGDKRLVAYIVSNLIPDRLPYQTECLVELGNGIQKLLQTQDISLNGVGLIGNLDVTLGQEIHLQLQLPNKQPHLTGKIAWHQGREIGVQLILTPETKSLLHQTYQDLLVSTGILKSLQRVLTTNLRNYLKEKLPSYMIPSSFVLLEAMPLTPNGKVNRRTLPAPMGTALDKVDGKNLPSTPIEIMVSQIWAELLGLKLVGVNDNFFELGGNSLLVVRLLSQLRQALGVDLPVHCLFEFPTIAGITQVIEKARQTGMLDNITENIPDLNTEAVLDAKIQPQLLGFNDVSEPKCIFLTGATGFFGTYLLSELLQQTTADIYCLVRAPNPDEGKKRLQTKLEAYSLWDESFSSRIIAIGGDLSQPRLGVTVADFQHLASCIDVIYHNGALVNHIYPYSALKAANVTATEDILRLASQIKVKPVHFISTLSVFDLSKYSQFEVISESDPLNDSQSGGYAQSKWVAEKLIMIARERGLPVCIYRLGRVTGHSKTGIGNTNDSISIMIKGCIQFGIFPELEMMVEMLPVDFVSQAIIAISQAKSSFGKAFHITTNPAHNQISWNDLTKWIQHFGYSVKQISFVDWHKELIDHINYSPENALHSLLPVFKEESDFQKVEIKFDNQNMLKALSSTIICCPQLNEYLLKTYFSYFLNIGFLSKPEQTNFV